MTADLSELLRLLLNLIRLDTIAEIDHDEHDVRVQVGNNLTTWRPWATTRAGDAQTWWPPSLGEKVILPAVYSDQFAPPSTNPEHHTTRCSDGAVIQYDSAAHTLSATLPVGTSVTAPPDQVTYSADDTVCTGNLSVLKNLTVTGMSSLNGGMAVTPGANAGAALGEAMQDDLIETNPLYGWQWESKEAPDKVDDVDPFTADEQALILNCLFGQERNFFNSLFGLECVRRS